MLSPIHHTFGPHVDRAYVNRVLALSYFPHKYVNGTSIEELRKDLTARFGGSTHLFGSGRESLLALLKAINLRSGEEVIVQGYTCVVVPNAIHAAGGVPVFADIHPENLNLSVETVTPLLTNRTRAIICQHTFGIPADTLALRKFCDDKKILLIEDCAHILPDNNGPKEVGTHFDAMILSFGRDKAISGISGGAVIVKNPATSSALQKIEADAVLHTWWEVAKLLEYATRMHSIVRPLSFCGLQKPFIKLLNLLGLFVPVVTEDEKNGHMSPILHKIPNACASLALISLKNLQTINDHRRRLTKIYLDEGKKRNWPMLSGVTDDLPLQKFPLFVKNAKMIRTELKKKNIHLDDGWTGCVICPESCDASAAGYENGDDPNAQMVGEQILSLPTHPTMTERQAKWLIQEMNHLLN